MKHPRELDKDTLVVIVQNFIKAHFLENESEQGNFDQEDLDEAGIEEGDEFWSGDKEVDTEWVHSTLSDHGLSPNDLETVDDFQSWGLRSSAARQQIAGQNQAQAFHAKKAKESQLADMLKARLDKSDVGKSLPGTATGNISGAAGLPKVDARDDSWTPPMQKAIDEKTKRELIATGLRPEGEMRTPPVQKADDVCFPTDVLPSAGGFPSSASKGASCVDEAQFRAEMDNVPTPPSSGDDLYLTGDSKLTPEQVLEVRKGVALKHTLDCNCSVAQMMEGEFRADCPFHRKKS